MKNLAVEVMVLEYCPRPRLFETLAVGDAVARFFEAAAKADHKPERPGRAVRQNRSGHELREAAHGAV